VQHVSNSTNTEKKKSVSYVKMRTTAWSGTLGTGDSESEEWTSSFVRQVFSTKEHSQKAGIKLPNPPIEKTEEYLILVRDGHSILRLSD
jgi:hypothetical protein